MDAWKNKNRLVYVVPEEWMTSQRLMLFRLDGGCELSTPSGERVASKDVPLGRHIVLTDEVGLTLTRMGQVAKEYHLIRDIRVDKRGRWRPMSEYEVTGKRQPKAKKRPAPNF